MLRRVIAIALASSALRVILACRYFGFETGDDVEIAQEAFRAALGLDYAPWAIRNLLVSEVIVAPFVKAGSLAGIDDPFHLALLARMPFVLLSGLNIILLYLVGRVWCSERTALLASALYSFHWLPLVYGSSLYPRIPATTAVLAAVLLVARNVSARRAAGAGALIAAAFAMRYSEVIFLASMLLLIGWAAPLSRRLSVLLDGDRRESAQDHGWVYVLPLLAGFVAGALLLVGLFDWLTWGRPFASLIAFTRYTLIAGASSSRVAEQPAWWYLLSLLHWVALPLLPFLWPARKVMLHRMIALIVVPLIALSAIHHKELRYLQAMIPFVMLGVAAGAAVWWREGRRTLVVVLFVLALPLQLARIRSVEKRSMAAVEAARMMAARGVERIALSQSWAYGGRILFGNAVVLEELGIPPEPSRLAAVAPSADCIAIYRSDSTPQLLAIAAREGLGDQRTFERQRSRSVIVMCR